MAARNNPLINWMNMSFDTFNLLHRWFGRIVVLEALAHTIAWIVTTVSTTGWAAVQKAITGTPFIMYGFIVSSPPTKAFYTQFTDRVYIGRGHNGCSLYSGSLYLPTRIL